MGGSLVQGSGKEEPGGKQGLSEALPISQGWHGHSRGIKQEAWHEGVNKGQDAIPEK